VNVDGSTGRCSCGFDGNYWCEPDWNSSEFDRYWSYVDEGFLDYETYMEWSAHHMYYIYMRTGPMDCMGIFEEMQYFEEVLVGGMAGVV
jgi:hypothetical protein